MGSRVREKLDLYITLTGTLLVAFYYYFEKLSLTELAVRLIIAIIISYVIGFFIKLFFDTVVFAEKENLEETELESNEEGDDDEGETLTDIDYDED